MFHFNIQTMLGIYQRIQYTNQKECNLKAKIL